MIFNTNVNKEEILDLLADGFAEKGEFRNDFTVKNIKPLFKNNQWSFEIEIETDQ